MFIDGKWKHINCMDINCFNDNIKCNLPCTQLKRLKSTMSRYYTDEFTDVDVKVPLNDLLHLLQYHNDNDDEFECIFNVLGGYCAIKQCVIFQRNNRNRNHNRKPQHVYQEHVNVPVCQIMDKIHCFYRHSFDIGNILHSKQKSIIDNRKYE
eukprot:246337_1